MRRNLTGTSSRGKFFNTCLKATVLVLLFAVLCLAFSFSVSGVASADTSVSQVFANSSSASANEAVVSGSDDENEAVTSGEATAAETGGGTSWILSSPTITATGASRTIGGASWVGGNMSSSNASWYWTGDTSGSNKVTSSDGSTLSIESNSHTATQSMYIVFNLKFYNPELAYILANGASLSVTTSVTLKNQGHDLSGLGVGAGNDNTTSSPKKAGTSVTGKITQFDSTGTIDADEGYTISNVTTKLTGWSSSTNAKDGYVSFYVVFQVRQDGYWLSRTMTCTLSNVKMSAVVDLPTDSDSPYNTVNIEPKHTSPYITSIENLPFNYGDTATDTEGAYTRFPNLLSDLENSVDGISSSGNNTDTLNLKSYTNSQISTVGGSVYYKKTYMTITENSLLKSITIAATDTENYVFNFYENQSAVTKTGWIKNGEGQNVYYYSLYRSSVKAATLTLYFAQNTTVTVTTADYVGNSAGVTKITVSGIETNDSDLSKLSVLSINGDDTVADLLNSGKLGRRYKLDILA